ncbi:MAG: L-serine ammonia-lyase [Gammaproteobacteria bacterium]|nr:L-serine ammonia-lyase [Gammaproteobacteria bacterium]
MAVSVFDLFKIGIGPSSSHTVGPMRAALMFAHGLRDNGLLQTVRRIKVELYGSLGATGKGHGSDKAVLLGLEGEIPERVEPDSVPERLQRIRDAKQVALLGSIPMAFDEVRDLIFHRRLSLPFHANGMRLTAFASAGEKLHRKKYYSIGGGFVVTQDELGNDQFVADTVQLPHPFLTGAELLEQCQATGLSISRLMLANETAWRTEAQIRAKLLNIWKTMQSCVRRGCQREGVLPGGMRVKRRAAGLYRQLRSDDAEGSDPMVAMDWVNLYALAVNEENAAGGRVVTAPTNGAAGIVPAVIHYYQRFCQPENDDGIVSFLLTAAAIGILYRENASISGAEVGCQGEVGVACSMAAGALAEVMGGTPEQVENAAEIGMEHNLGLTCDPVGGLVQVPCIERNAMGAVKAINAARLALRGDGTHFVSLDKVIKTMRETGADMKTKYKETARGGLAVNVVEC